MKEFDIQLVPVLGSTTFHNFPSYRFPDSTKHAWMNPAEPVKKFVIFNEANRLLLLGREDSMDLAFLTAKQEIPF